MLILFSDILIIAEGIELIKEDRMIKNNIYFSAVLRSIINQSVFFYSRFDFIGQS